MFGLPIDPLLIVIALVFVFLTLLVVSLIFVNSYTFFGRWLSFLQKERDREQDKIMDNAYAKAEDILEGAKDASLRIIEESNEKAQETIGSAKELSANAGQELKAHLDTVAKKHLELLNKTSAELNSFYKQVVGEQKEKSISTLQSAAKDIEKELEAEVEDFKNVLHQETVESQKKVEDKLTAAYDQVAKEIEVYKDEKMRQVESKIFSLIAEVSKEVIGKAMSMEDKQELVLKALEDAKRKEGFLNGDKE